MNVAVVLTVSRLLLTVPILLFLLSGTPTGAALALMLLWFGVITDILDGRIARVKRCVTEMGAFLDPLCDKIFVYFIVAFFVMEGTISFLVAVPMVARDLVVECLRTVSASRGSVLGANTWGKLKFSLQIASLTFSCFAFLLPLVEVDMISGTIFAKVANVSLGAAFIVSLPGACVLLWAFASGSTLGAQQERQLIQRSEGEGESLRA